MMFESFLVTLDLLRRKQDHWQHKMKHPLLCPSLFCPFLAIAAYSGSKTIGVIACFATGWVCTCSTLGSVAAKRRLRNVTMISTKAQGPYPVAIIVLPCALASKCRTACNYADRLVGRCLVGQTGCCWGVIGCWEVIVEWQGVRTRSAPRKGIG